ncbi:hypothetical protein JST99_02885 [Candidatus Dependentiae bacterium]|nr:hypothetical protein [Candidatus Dependentiae bacterium]
MKKLQTARLSVLQRTKKSTKLQGISSQDGSPTFQPSLIHTFTLGKYGGQVAEMTQDCMIFYAFSCGTTRWISSDTESALVRL